jgi:hypothetical protein
MPSRPDLREIASHVREAFAEVDRETLLEILTFVVKEYVVEGPPPMLVHQAETLADLQGASFAQIIAALQTRFDHPELQMFVVDGEQVSVRVGGVMQPLVGVRQPLQGTAAELPRPAAGVRVVETTLQQRPPQPAPASPSAAPPPVRGLSVRGRATGEGGAAPPSPQAGQPAPPSPAAGAAQPGAPAQPAAPAADKDKSETGGDDASARFSLLELD